MGTGPLSRGSLSRLSPILIMSSLSCWGLCYYHPISHHLFPLPLLRVRAVASIKELAAQVKLTQTFHNDTPSPVDAVYSFPVPGPRASVCGFTMIRHNGTRVKGVVEERVEAPNTHDEAASQGKTATLMTQQTPEVFQISVGNIYVEEQVQIEIIYATELTEDEESDSIHFHLPRHIGCQYGSSPSALTGPLTFGRSTTFMTINVAVETTTPIKKVACPSHAIATEHGPDPNLPNANDLPFANYARLSLSSDSPLDKDFVLSVKSVGLDSPRCIAELHPAHNTVAVALTLVPRFSLPDRHSQEFIFLIDCSGCMGGRRIEAARKALVIILRCLPHRNTVFQIASFGSSASLLWEDGSRPYTQETLDQATRHVDDMLATYNGNNGTELRQALEMCFRHRSKDRPTDVFLLTGGGAWDHDWKGIFAEVANAVDGALAKSPLRVFCLGIGDSASTAMCEGVARVGNGACLMVGEKEHGMTGKIARLVKAAKGPSIRDVRVDWGENTKNDGEFELVELPNTAHPKARQTVNSFDASVDDMAVDLTPAPLPANTMLPPPQKVQQCPFTVRTLLPSFRFFAYAIVQGQDKMPKTVVIRAKTEDDTITQLRIPVALSHLPNDGTDSPPAIHALAALPIIQEYEDGQYHRTLRKDFFADIPPSVKAHVVRFAKTYSLSSAHTSFVAVVESSPRRPRLPVGTIQLATAAATSSASIFGIPSFHPNLPQIVPVQSTGPSVLGAPSPSSSAGSSNVPQEASTRPPLFGGFGASPSSFQFGSTFNFDSSAPSTGAALFGSGATSFSTSFGSGMQSQQQSATSATLSALLPSSLSGGLGYGNSSSSGPPLDSSNTSTQSAASSSRLSGQTLSSRLFTPSDPLEVLARLQAFDGGFSLAVLGVVNPALTEEDARAAFHHGLDDRTIATVLAMAFISGKIGKWEDKVAWEGIYEKAEAYLEDALNGSQSVHELFIKVVDLVA